MPSICSVATWDDYIVLPYGSLTVMSFDIMTESIVYVDCFSICMFAPEFLVYIY